MHGGYFLPVFQIYWYFIVFTTNLIVLESGMVWCNVVMVFATNLIVLEIGNWLGTDCVN